jgi:hypothetical protein
MEKNIPQILCIVYVFGLLGMGMRLEQSGDAIASATQNVGFNRSRNHRNSRKFSLIYWAMLIIFVVYIALSFYMGA